MFQRDFDTVELETENIFLELKITKLWKIFYFIIIIIFIKK